VTPRLHARDLAAVLAIVGLGLALRLHFFSGLGLGDDPLLRNDMAAPVRGTQLPGGPNGYRFAWWIPTAITARWWGLGEAGLITPIVVMDVLGMVLVALFAGQLWGGWSAVAAALMLAVFPLDVAWSTMLSTDFFLSFFMALCMFGVVRAITTDHPTRRARGWTLAAVALWLGFHSKVSAVLLVPALAVVAWANRHALKESLRCFVGPAALLFGGSAIVFLALDGNPVAPFHEELAAQGLVGPGAAALHTVIPETFKLHPRWLFVPDSYGNLVYSIYPHALILFLLAGAALRIAPFWPVLWWLFFVFLGMEFNVQRAAGVWVAGFRNVRHGHVFVYPIVLLVTGYLVAFRARWPKVAHQLLAVLVAIGLWQSIRTATLTHVAFGDSREATRYLATLPKRPVYSDFQLGQWLTYSGLQEAGWSLVPAEGDDAKRAQQFATADGYVVTGGAREPYYGCSHCIPRAANLSPERWTLLKEIPSPIPPTVWRPEPVRIWARK